MSVDNPQRGEASTQQPTELKRAIGPKLLLLFIVGDILGTGVYALTGQVANEVGGAAWVPFLIAFLVATITAFSYLELVTRFPQAAGAALYTHKAFGIHIFTFMVAFAVMCSGITSASTAAYAFADFFNAGFGIGLPKGGWTLMSIALLFMLLVAGVNFRGVSESVKANVVLTMVELSGLLMVIFIGMYAVTQGRADFSRVVVFDSPSDKGVFLAVSAATALAFFAMVGFEDSVNMAEETENPKRDFPRMMLTGLGITGLIYVLVSITAVALVPVGELADPERDSALIQVVAAGGPGLPFDQIFPFIGMFAVANTALINMLMASRLLYGMARAGVLPKQLGKVHSSRQTPWVAIIFTTLIALGLIVYVVRANATTAGAANITLLGGTTSLLLRCVFTIVNIALIVIRRKYPSDGDHFKAPYILPFVGAIACAFLAGPWARNEAQQTQYVVAGGLMVVGLILWAITYLATRKSGREVDINQMTED
ncbi:amino acid permease [Epidermidibacterium keratini]|uniref:Amino acid permease n=1 Tax=Epidermidibacterium keratini TaxID=1891644 RepID=A0A7L4YT21_9ACTN|nr:APC family permease [Epidermidibacterium keratini]QHC01677.1 amino acid permease [Epidermidibacterium keratini]